MRRLLLGIGCALLLACGGLVEEIAESVVGGEVDIRADGMDMDLPDGAGHVSMDWGEAATHPGELDLSPPPGGEIQLSGSITFPDQPSGHFAIYTADAAVDALLPRYRQELADKGLTIEEGTGDDGSPELRARKGEIVYFVSVAASTDGSGGSAVTLGKGPPDGLEKGLDASPR